VFANVRQGFLQWLGRVLQDDLHGPLVQVLVRQARTDRR
jgi:hypothetical protein